MSTLSTRKKKTAGPLSAAGLISFYEDVKSSVELSPVHVLIIATVFTAIVLALRVALG